jgi:hypothetical protein
LGRGGRPAAGLVVSRIARIAIPRAPKGACLTRSGKDCRPGAFAA